VSPGSDGAGVPRGPAGPLLAYPLDYVFKVIGLAGEDFADHVRGLIAAAGLTPLEVTVRPSSQGKYHSVSIEVRLVREEERQAVYRALAADPRVVYYL